MLDRPTITALAELSERVATASDQVLESIRIAIEAQQTLNAVNVRIHQLVSFAEREHDRSAVEIPGISTTGIAPVEKSPETAPASGDLPQAHDGRGIVTSAAEVVDEVEEGPDAAEAGSTHGTAQSGQAVEGAAPVSAGAAPTAERTITDAVLDRFSTTGDPIHAIAQDLNCHIGLVSDIMREARRRGDPRADAGDQRLVGKNLREMPSASPNRDEEVEQPAPPRLKPPKPSQPSKPTIPPDPDDIGIHLVEVDYSAGRITQLETEASVALKGAQARVVDRLKDQKIYGVEALWKDAGRFVSERVFRMNLATINTALREIGLTVHEQPNVGMQLRKLAN